ncbi:MAG: efflux RND transporter periplasmic adaptor subunit [Candidatus Krumholzibacteria bacterium]|nr:efflux RND transporter periplasmic adaptor subunit [Candidatus Krumholzibacteria bacterium]MDH4335887.1 efflux RND transporter periplasmic adaptor subunit [Candidatus Krumholzibacteria bacterium]MDH5268537.1 efflux RND transporter periplasmic adaptor subunit [Candidatus Krumholzibacteria bacterium]
MKKLSRRSLVILLCSIVAVLVVAVVVVRPRLGGSGSDALASDTTLAGDSTAVAKSGEKKKGDKKGKKDKDKKKQDTRVPVEVTTVSPRSISTYYQTTATLESEKRVDILSKISGEVKQIVVEEGDRVKEGALLCSLDDAEAAVALEQARINRDKQQVELERLEAMHEQNLISDKEYLDVKYQYELAANSYESARVKYEYTQIRAPFDGVVTSRLVDPGENIAMGTRLFVVTDNTPLLLSMYLPEGEARRVHPGQRVFIRPDTDPDAQFVGEILRIAPEVDLRTGTVKVTAQTTGGGVPGSFVRVSILMDTHDGVLAVPRRAVVADAGDHFVYVAAADTVRKAPVDVGYEDETHAEITSGLASGDTVVTAGVGGIREGSKVKLVPPENLAADKNATGDKQ